MSPEKHLSSSISSLVKMAIQGVLLLIVANLPLGGFAQVKQFSKQEIKEDLAFLRTQLEAKHPNFHLYTSATEVNAFFDQLTVPDSLSETEAYSVISSLHQIIRDGHTLLYPNADFLQRNHDSGLFLPLQPFWDGDKLYLLHDYRPDSKLIPGTEIVSLNGVPAQEVIHQMLGGMMQDGNHAGYPIWVLNSFFFEYYSYFYGCSAIYDVVLQDEWQQRTHRIPGMAKADLFQQLAAQSSDSRKGLHLTLLPTNHTALLSIPDWHSKILRKRYGQRFLPEIKKCIQQIEAHNIQHLIIDVRNNQGGDTRNSKYLLSYLLAEPFTLVESYHKMKKGALVQCKGPHRGLHQPLASPFSGKVYVLTNGGSFSNSGIFCATLKQHHRAVFIGEETGGSESVFAGNAKQVRLPHTGINAHIPQLRFQLKNFTPEDLHGIQPDFEKKPTIASLLKGEDLALTFTLQLIAAAQDSSHFPEK